GMPFKNEAANNIETDIKAGPVSGDRDAVGAPPAEGGIVRMADGNEADRSAIGKNAGEFWRDDGRGGFGAVVPLEVAIRECADAGRTSGDIAAGCMDGGD